MQTGPTDKGRERRGQALLTESPSSQPTQRHRSRNVIFSNKREPRNQFPSFTLHHPSSSLSGFYLPFITLYRRSRRNRKYQASCFLRLPQLLLYLSSSASIYPVYLLLYTTQILHRKRDSSNSTASATKEKSPKGTSSF